MIASDRASRDHVGLGDEVLSDHAVPDVPGHVVHEPASGTASGRSWSAREPRDCATRLLRELEEIISCNRKGSELTDDFQRAGIAMYHTLLSLLGSDPFIIPAIVGTLMGEFPYIDRGDVYERVDGIKTISESYVLFLIEKTVKSVEARRNGEKGWEFY